MKETPLHKAFEQAMKKIEDDPWQANVAAQLAVMRQVAVDFQEADMPVTLQVRHRDKDSVFDEDEHEHGEMLANGAIIMGEVKLDFFIAKHRYDEDCMELKMFRDGEETLRSKLRYDAGANAWDDETEDEDGGDDYDAYDEEEEIDWDSDPDANEKPCREPADLKTVLTEVLINIRAEETFIGRFNVGPNTGVGTAVDKSFNVSPPLKLKKLGPS